MSQITVEKLRELGVEKVSEFAGCIQVNYLVFMNNGFNGLGGYSIKQLEKIEERQVKHVKNNFEEYIQGVVKAINTEPETKTDEYLQQAYKEWFS